MSRTKRSQRQKLRCVISFATCNSTTNSDGLSLSKRWRQRRHAHWSQTWTRTLRGCWQSPNRCRKWLNLFRSHVNNQLTCKSSKKDHTLFPTTRARTSKKARTVKSLGRTRSTWTAMINLLLLRKNLQRAARLARTNHLANKSIKKLQSRLWSHLISKEKNQISRSKKSLYTTNRANRRPNFVSRRNPPTKQYTVLSILTFPQRKLNSKQAFNLMRVSKPLTSKIRMPKRYRCQQTLPMNPFSENVTNGPRPTWCRTTRNLPRFTSSTTPERWQRNGASKQRISTKSAAQPWLKKRRQW